ncbi:hypothetical protein, conserved [Eimeria tenella]|uniref:Uncharacterized protein n=1 Tax=Eimeria tenella TaxID=5802 RepID=U6KUY3_EIMTE|nr:hypothetical protein, conserved [Eimeria tenella]CDJ41781.1 hypothetical protein, conserved [Eimeria tenella]|eukprot:XP_013232531.1 hypothetical protein, conserved [Eimeria tenella]
MQRCFVPAVCLSLCARSFAPQFISENLGAAADSIAVEASAEFASAAEKAGTPEVVQPRAKKIQKIIWDFQKLFISYVILAAFVGDNPAVVFNVEAATREQESAANVSGKNDGEANGPSARVVAWPFGAPEVFRKNIELQKLGSDKNDEKLHNSLSPEPSEAPFTPMASSLPDFAVQPLHNDIVAVVWGTPSFWDALSIDTVGSLLFAFLQSRDRQDTNESLSLHEEASEFLLRKAIVQAVTKNEEAVGELLYHPAALRAAGLPHWKDSRLEIKRRAALGNRKAELELMKCVVAAQEGHLNKNALAFALSRQPFFESGEGKQNQNPKTVTAPAHPESLQGSTEFLFAFPVDTFTINCRCSLDPNESLRNKAAE